MLHSSSDSYSSGNAQPAHIEEVRHETFKIGRKNRVDKSSGVPSVATIRSVNKLFADAFKNQTDRLIQKSNWYDDNIASDLNNMNKKTAVQLQDRTFSGNDPCRLLPFSRISR